MQDKIIDVLLKEIANDLHIRQPSSEEEILFILRKHFSFSNPMEDNFVSTIQIPEFNQD